MYVRTSSTRPSLHTTSLNQVKKLHSKKENMVNNVKTELYKFRLINNKANNNKLQTFQRYRVSLLPSHADHHQ